MKIKTTQWTPWLSKRVVPKGREHSFRQQIEFAALVLLLFTAIFIGATIITWLVYNVRFT